jgi:hypothetical protein
LYAGNSSTFLVFSIRCLFEVHCIYRSSWCDEESLVFASEEILVPGLKFATVDGREFSTHFSSFFHACVLKFVADDRKQHFRNFLLCNWIRCSWRQERIANLCAMFFLLFKLPVNLESVIAVNLTFDVHMSVLLCRIKFCTITTCHCTWWKTIRKCAEKRTLLKDSNWPVFRVEWRIIVKKERKYIQQRWRMSKSFFWKSDIGHVHA